MNKSTTKDIIADAFESLIAIHPYKKITVNMICQEAHVARNSFYYYYESKLSLAEYVCIRDCLVYSLPYLTIIESDFYTRTHFSYIYEKKELYYALYEIDQGVTLFKLLMKAKEAAFIDERMGPLKDVDKQDILEDIEFFALYAAAGITILQVYWIENKMKYSVDTMTKKLKWLYTNSLKSSLDSLINKG